MLVPVLVHAVDVNSLLEGWPGIGSESHEPFVYELHNLCHEFVWRNGPVLCEVDVVDAQPPASKDVYVTSRAAPIQSAVQAPSMHSAHRFIEK